MTMGKSGVGKTSIDVAIARELARCRHSVHLLLVTLPEATPVHEAGRLQDDLRRAQIEPFAWIINQCFTLSGTSDTLLAARGFNELKYIEEVTSKLAKSVVILPWLTGGLKSMEPGD